MKGIMTPRHVALWIAFAAIMLLLPQVVSNGTLRIIIFANFLAIFAMSWDFLSGKTGYVSFGHPFLIGIGAYTTAILSYRFHMPIEYSIPIAVLTTIAGGTFFFLPALRIKGTYFALVTLAFMELIYQLTQVIRPDLTGGTRGISGVKTLLVGAVPNYYFSFLLMLGIALVLWVLARTRLGTALDAIAMNEEAVSGSGLSTTKLKLFAFMVSAAVAGIGGAFYVHYLGSIAPRALFDIDFVFTIIVSALIGGASTIVGPMLGAFFMTFLLEYLRPLLPGSERYLIYGLVALVLYVYQPKGIYAIIVDLRDGMRSKNANNSKNSGKVGDGKAA
jgi:branched-chain amino acid transport system permease protein